MNSASDINKELKRHANILELGSGIGLLGIALCKSHPSSNITLSDVDNNVIKRLKFNINLNELQNVNVNINKIDWLNDNSILFNTINPQVIIATDVIYHDELFEPLLNTLKYIMVNIQNFKLCYIIGVKRNENTFDKFLNVLSSTLRGIDCKFLLQFLKNFIYIYRMFFNNT